MTPKSVQDKNEDSFIVSTNYNDKHSPFRWLVREKSEPHDKVQPYKTIFATNVHFVCADTTEHQRGCQRVAHCSVVTGSNDLQDVDITQARELEYTLHYFRDKDTQEAIHYVNSLYLDQDGKIWYEVKISSFAFKMKTSFV